MGIYWKKKKISDLPNNGEITKQKLHSIVLFFGKLGKISKNMKFIKLCCQY